MRYTTVTVKVYNDRHFEAYSPISTWIAQKCKGLKRFSRQYLGILCGCGSRRMRLLSPFSICKMCQLEAAMDSRYFRKLLSHRSREYELYGTALT